MKDCRIYEEHINHLELDRCAIPMKFYGLKQFLQFVCHAQFAHNLFLILNAVQIQQVVSKISGPFKSTFDQKRSFNVPL